MLLKAVGQVLDNGNGTSINCGAVVDFFNFFILGENKRAKAR